MKNFLSAEESRNILNTLITETSDVIWVKDKQGRYIIINEAGAKVLKHSIQDIIGKTNEELFPDETVKKIRNTDQEVIECGHTKVFEDTLLTPDGPKTYLAVKSVYRDDQGCVQGVFVISPIVN